MALSINSNIKRKLGWMVATTFGGLLLLLVFFHHTFSDNLHREKRHQSKSLATASIGVINSFYSQFLAGKLTEVEAKHLAQTALAQATYDQCGYFWIHDLQGNLVMHPMAPEHAGQPIEQWLNKEGVTLFKRFDDTAQQGGGWVEYQWPKPGEITKSPKLSYVALFEPWQWVVGTGIYLEDSHKEIERSFIRSLEVLAIVFGSIVIVSWILARRFTLQLEELAIRDPLTTLYTRRYLNETQDLFVRHDMRDKASHLYVIFLDIDYFKNINDRYGHLTGDAILSNIGHWIRQQTRADDLCVRYGGEEFLVITLATSHADIINLTERIRHPTYSNTHPPALPKVTLSAGVAMRQPEEDFHSLLSRADQLLYKAKRQGRNCVVMDSI